MERVSEGAAGYEISTCGVDLRETFAYWEALVSSSVVPASIAPVSDRPFHARLLTTVADSDFTLTIGAGGPQLAHRTPRHISRSDDQFLLAVVTVAGSSLFEHDGTVVRLEPGSITLVDTLQPNRMLVGDYCEKVIVQIPREVAVERSRLPEAVFAERLRYPLKLPTGGFGSVLAQYFYRFAKLPPQPDDDLGLLTRHGTNLLLSAMAFGSGGERPSADLTYECVLAYLREHFTEGSLSAEQVARECLISRRTLQRVTEPSGGVRLLVQRLRLEHARQLLVDQPARRIGAIAAACGFANERTFYRAFRAETGMAPGEFRATQRAPEPTVQPSRALAYQSRSLVTPGGTKK